MLCELSQWQGISWPRGLLLGALPRDGPPIPLKLLDTLGATLLALALVASKVEAPHSTLHVQDTAFSLLCLLLFNINSVLRMQLEKKQVNHP